MKYLKKSFKKQPIKPLVCKKCSAEQVLAKGWDYQICDCGEYFYDNRNKEKMGL
jgi:hypothetical protein